jgi:dihydrofolate synthase/folylpolyglutamate synthase
VDRREALAWLDGHVNLETGVGAPAAAPGARRGAPTLGRIAALLELLGSPQLEYPAIHVTGTNGKTSVTRMISALLAASGVAAGAYTSPHLQSVHERMMREGEPIDDQSLVEQLEAVALVEDFLDQRPSYFEIVTAAALRWFGDVALDVAVIEVGLGGTWDATNVVDAAVAVITNVSVDHVEYLGHTRAEIATEKAGIVKPGATLVLGEIDPELAPIFEARDAARLLRRGTDFALERRRLAHGGQMLDLRTPGGRYPDVLLALHGAHQADNAAIALAATEAFLGGPLDEDAVAEAFATVRSPGRLEVVGHQPLVLLDGAHNVAGAQALVGALAEEFPATPRTLVVGILREKDPLEMLEALDATSAATVVCCAPPSPRALEATALATAARELGIEDDRIVVARSVEDAIDVARRRTPSDGHVVVTGSLYLVGAARGVLVGR